MLYTGDATDTGARGTLLASLPAESQTMKSPWAQTLAWIAAVAVALMLALAFPDEASIERHAFPSWQTGR